MPDHPDANVESAATSASNLLNSAPMTDKDVGNQVDAAAAQEQRKKSGIRSVRDAFRNAVTRVGNTADRLKSAVGAGKGSDEFEAARKEYQNLERQLKDFTDIPLKIVDLAMDGKVAPLERFPQKKKHTKCWRTVCCKKWQTCESSTLALSGQELGKQFTKA